MIVTNTVSLSEGETNLNPTPTFLWVPDHMGLTFEIQRVLHPGFYFDFYTNCGYIRVDVSPLVGD